MKALTIAQPYAELIASGEKRVENRGWRTPYRGLLAIHAGKSRAWLTPDSDPDVPFGAFVAVAELRAVVPVGELPAALRGHAHAFGPWCWLLGRVVRLPRPLPAKGYQTIWTPSRDDLARLAAIWAGEARPLVAR